jgi:LysM repeat protein
MLRTLLLVFGAVLIILAPARMMQAQPQAQGGLTCEELVTLAVTTVGVACDTLGRNQACYGNRNIEAEFREDIDSRFDNTGDLVDLLALSRLRTAAFDSESRTWGIALMKAQANLPDALPGQNVTFLLFGDATLENPSPDMRAVTLSTGLGGDIACENTPPSALVIQAPQGTQVSMNINGADVIIGSTAWLTTVNDNTSMHIATIEGIVVVSAFDEIRVITPGARIGMPMGEDLQVTGPPSPLRAFDFDAISRSPLSLLDEPVTVPDPIVPDPLLSTPSGTPALPTQTPIAGCVPRADWTARYIVQSGDTLSSIAARAGVRLNDLAAGNCITNVSRINVGQVINVPFALPTNTPVRPTNTATATVTATQAGMIGPNLRADATTIEYGHCTTIRWDVSNIREVYFQGQGVVGSGSQEVCPSSTTTYQLVVIQMDGTSVPFNITINVQPPATPECGNSICEPGEADTCSFDCGAPSAVCGNGICEPGETAETCSDCIVIN